MSAWCLAPGSAITPPPELNLKTSLKRLHDFIRGIPIKSLLPNLTPCARKMA